jgi:hypothetical protein
MKKSTLLLALAVTGLLVSSSSAQVFVGSDDFNAGATTKWDYSFRFAGSGTNGTLDFANNRLDFTKGAGQGSFVRIWDSEGTASPAVNSLSYSTSWSMTLTTTNTLSVTGGEFATIGLQVENDNTSYSALMLSSTSTGNFIQAEGTGFTSSFTPTANNTDVALRLTWDAGAQTLAAAYSLDGTNFTSVASFLPVTQWNNTGGGNVTNGFNFEVFGNSNLAASLSAGSVYADNFSVSAIPEPSTYAAFAGLGALGLAIWRRRQATRA